MADLVGPTPKEKRNTPGMHSVEGQLKVSLGSGKNDEVISIELAGVTEGVRGKEFCLQFLDKVVDVPVAVYVGSASVTCFLGVGAGCCGALRWSQGRR